MDLNGREIAAMVPIVIAALALGFAPKPALDLVTPLAEQVAVVVQTDSAAAPVALEGSQK